LIEHSSKAEAHPGVIANLCRRKGGGMEFAMRFCTECGAAIADDKKFWTECGSPVSVETAQPQETVHTETPPAPAPAAPVYSAPAAASAPIPAYTAPAPTAPIAAPAAPAYTAPAAAPVAPVYAASTAAPAAPVYSVPTAAPVAAVYAVPASPAPQAGQAPPHGGPYAVMSIGSFIGSSVLMSIPVSGWLICIIWACGGCKNHNKRNYARSILVFLIIGLIFYLLIRWMFGGFLNLVQAWIILQGRT
jgi:hypothetical protein